MQDSEVQSNVIRVRVSDLLFALQKRWMLIVALSLVGLTFGLILSAMTVVQSSYQTFSVNGSFAVTSKNINGKYVGGYDVPNINDYHLAEDMVDAVRYVLRSDRVLGQVITSNELLGYSIPQLRNAVTVTQYNSTQVLEMKIVWRNAEEGVALWNAIVSYASDILPETLQLGSLAVINEPQAEQLGVVGSGSNRVVLLTLLGFAAGVGFAIIELLMHPTLNNVRDVETLFGLETIGIIPRDAAFYKHKGSIMTQEDRGSSVVVQNFSAAAYILRNRLGTKEEHHCFYVTSAALGEGRTTVAANLAIQLSDMEHRVLLIDFDTRNPSLGALFLNKVDYAHSLNALYRGDATEEEAITTLSGYLDLLPAVLEHNTISVDSVLIELIEKLKQQYEYVILDAPPVGVVSGTLSLNQVANTVLFVIGYDISTLPEIQSTLEKLDKSGTRVLGCVVNNVISGRDLGMKQTADDYKKSISRKAREKKREEEKFGLNDLPETPERNHLFKRKHSDEAEAENTPAGETGQQSADGQFPKRRNVYEDSMDRPEKKLVPRSEQAVVQELYKIGIEGSWNTEAQQAEPQTILIENPGAEQEPSQSESGDLPASEQTVVLTEAESAPTAAASIPADAGKTSSADWVISTGTAASPLSASGAGNAVKSAAAKKNASFEELLMQAMEDSGAKPAKKRRKKKPLLFVLLGIVILVIIGLVVGHFLGANPIQIGKSLAQRVPGSFREQLSPIAGSLPHIFLNK